MPRVGKRKSTGKNNTGLYQDQPHLSIQNLALTGLDAWLIKVVAGRPPHVWLLSGPVGAGKTTLVQHLAGRLGISSTITSPTFALQKTYPLRGQPWTRLVHIDAYRIRSGAETAALELDELIADQKTLLVVEWPERLPTITWGRCLVVRLSLGTKPRTRSISVGLV